MSLDQMNRRFLGWNFKHLNQIEILIVRYDNLIRRNEVKAFLRTDS